MTVRFARHAQLAGDGAKARHESTYAAVGTCCRAPQRLVFARCALLAFDHALCVSKLARRAAIAFHLTVHRRMIAPSTTNALYTPRP
eukprot:1989420-Prymnesium_polylepis.2